MMRLGLVKAAMEVGSLSHATGATPVAHISLRKSGGPDLQWERVGVRGYGLSSEQRPLARIVSAIRPLPNGELSQRISRYAEMACAG